MAALTLPRPVLKHAPYSRHLTSLNTNGPRDMMEEPRQLAIASVREAAERRELWRMAWERGEDDAADMQDGAE